jgi:polyisoprenoid-binding protein YceI
MLWMKPPGSEAVVPEHRGGSMKIRRDSIATAVACAMVFAALSARVATPAADTPITLGPGSTLWLEGKSNIHDFESRTTAVMVRFERDSSLHAPSTPAELEAFVRASGVRGMDVEVPVVSLHSGKGGLDKNLWKDLRSDQYPAIRFHLTQYTVAPQGAKSDTFEVRAEGTLAVAGRERPTSLTAHAHRADRGVWIEGSQELRMTDFGIKPRTMMLGTMRVKDAVTVRFRLLLVAGDESQDSPSNRSK